MTGPNNWAAARRQFRLYHEKVVRLETSRFIQALENNEVGLNFHATPYEHSVTIAGDPPDEESIDAFLLTFRMFWRDGDGISFRNIEKLYDTLPVSEELKQRFRQTKDEYNRFLNSPGYILIVEDGKTLTRRDIVENHLFGDKAHVNEVKRAVLEQWRVNMLVNFTLFELFNVLHESVRAFVIADQVNLQALQQLESATD